MACAMSASLTTGKSRSTSVSRRTASRTSSAVGSSGMPGISTPGAGSCQTFPRGVIPLCRCD